MRPLAFVLLTSGLFAAQASATVLNYVDTMIGSNETPPNASTATGSAFVSIDTGTNMLTVSEFYSGIVSTPTGAHIHCCAASGTAAAVALPFTSFPTGTAGSYTATYDLTLTATYTSGFLASSGGTAAGAEASLLSNMAAGLTYTNIHDSAFPGGEIRGQLAAAPEPGTWALSVVSLVGLAAMFRRRRQV